MGAIHRGPLRRLAAVWENSELRIGAPVKIPAPTSTEP